MNLNHDYHLAREKMVDTQLVPREIKDPGVLAAMRKVPRHRFVGSGLIGEAYKDHPLPIGQGQTISQPYIVARMTEALVLTGKEHTLEIGTGSGYQTAVLAELSRKVYTVERVKPLINGSMKLLDELGYTNVVYKTYDGTLGWEENSPYDAVIVTAGAPDIPRPLIDQLADGGRLVIPVGDKLSQELIRITKRKGKLVKKSFGGCRFVNLIGRHGWKD